MKRTVVLDIMNFKGDGPSATIHQVVVLKRYAEKSGLQVALVGMFKGKAKTDNLDITFLMIVPISQLTEIPA